jgi:hypothetical protein
MNFLFLFLLILVLLYTAGLPIYRKRPIVFTETKLLVIILFTVGFAIFSWKALWLLWLGILVLGDLSIFLGHFWITLGMEKANLHSALQKALVGTLTKFEPSDFGVKLLEPDGEIKMKNVFNNITIVTFNLAIKSKKHKLVKSVFQKFIDNYFFKI